MGQFITVTIFLFCLIVEHVFAADAIGTATVTIRAPIILSEEQAMNYGVVEISGEATVLTLAPSGEVSTSGAGILGGTPSAGAMRVIGTPNASLSISFQDAVLNYAGESITMTNFQHDAGASPSFDSSGQLLFHIGAEVALAEEQKSGTYSGIYTVSVNYP